jgi:hypothetical protein
MTEFERLELIDNFATQQMTYSTPYFTLLSAWLATAYLVGSKLTRPLVLIVSSIYLVWISFLPLGQHNFTDRHAIAVRGLEAMEPSYVLANPETAVAWGLSFLALQYVAILASLYFMWSFRRRRT